jgi:MFS family permease
VSVPVGLFGTVWAYRMLREIGVHRRQPIDWLGNTTFAGGLVLVMIGVTYGIQPYGGRPMGWQSPLVLTCLATGAALLAAFAVIETRVPYPMFKLPLWRLRAFTFGTLSTFLASIARGGLMFMLIIWLQGIWLPLHGYSFDRTPLWAGIYMLPLTVGIMLAGPASGLLSDRFGARPFATGGMLVSALSFLALWTLPTDFAYPEFAAILFVLGMSMGVFASPNRAGVMNSLPAADRGAGGGMNQTLQNSAQVLSIGIFFSLMISGLAATLPHALSANLQAHGVSPAVAHRAAGLPPVSVLFAAFLGYDPVQHLIGPAAFARLPHATAAALASRTTFPSLIAAPFRTGLHEAFAFAAVACVIAAAASWSRGTRYVADAERPPAGSGDPPTAMPGRHGGGVRAGRAGLRQTAERSGDGRP